MSESEPEQPGAEAGEVSTSRPEPSAAARRALAEAEARRNAAEASKPAVEIGGRGGKDPARFGDWEIKGRAIDF